MNRRAFTAKLFSFAAILALAPEIAFRRTLELKQDACETVYWTQSQCEFRYCSDDYLKAYNAFVKNYEAL